MFWKEEGSFQPIACEINKIKSIQNRVKPESISRDMFSQEEHLSVESLSENQNSIFQGRLIT